MSFPPVSNLGTQESSHVSSLSCVSFYTPSCDLWNISFNSNHFLISYFSTFNIVNRHSLRIVLHLLPSTQLLSLSYTIDRTILLNLQVLHIQKYIMYKRAREVAELLPLRCILNCLDTMDLMYVLATGQTSSLSKLMMQHEVTWLFRRSPRLHMVSSAITMDFQIAHCSKG